MPKKPKGKPPKEDFSDALVPMRGIMRDLGDVLNRFDKAYKDLKKNYDIAEVSSTPASELIEQQGALKEVELETQDHRGKPRGRSKR